MTTDDRSSIPEGTDPERWLAVPEAVSMTDFDAPRYLPYLDEFALTDAQKLEYLATIWSIARFFVQTDISPEIWGQILDPLTNPTAADSDEVESSRSYEGTQSTQEENDEA